MYAGWVGAGLGVEVYYMMSSHVCIRGPHGPGHPGHDLSPSHFGPGLDLI